LAVGAHPDDIEIGCGGTLLKHVDAGDEVHALVLTAGEGGGATPSVRKSEARAAAEVMGYASLTFGEVSALELSYVRQAWNEIIERVIDERSPCRAYIHTRHDRHQAHRAAAECSLIATRSVNDVLSFELPSTMHDFMPNLYVALSADNMRRKLKAIAAHASQAGKLYMDPKYVEARAYAWATRAGCREAVEAFCVERMVE